MLTIQHISLERPAFELSSFQRWRHYVLGSWNGKCHITSLFACSLKWRLLTGNVKHFTSLEDSNLVSIRIDNLHGFAESGRSQGCFIFHTQKMALWIQHREKGEQRRQARRTSKERFKREQCGCCGPAREGRPTHLCTRSKCQAFSGFLIRLEQFT